MTQSIEGLNVAEITYISEYILQILHYYTVAYYGVGPSVLGCAVMRTCVT